MFIIMSVALAACSSDDDFVGGGDAVTVGIRVSADYAGTTHAMNGDANAVEGEFINHVCLIITDANNNIVANLQPILDGEAVTGNLNQQTFTATLKVGKTYNLYAFANWRDVGCEEWTNIISRTGGTLTAAELNDIVLTDPASHVDISAGHYIPMSGRLLSVTAAEGVSIDVPMDRLVGKVLLTLTNENKASTTLDFGDICFKYAADRVSLFPSASNVAPDTNGQNDVTVSPAETQFTTTYTAYANGLAKGGTPLKIESKAENNSTPKSATVTFYVNETGGNSNDHFEVTMKTNENVEYLTQTQRKDIQRNTIFPVTLKFKRDNAIDLGVKAWAVPIDNAPVEYSKTNKKVYEGKESGIYVADVTEKLQITPTAKSSYTLTSVDYTYTEGDIEGVYACNVTKSDDAVRALTIDNFRAVPGGTFPITLTATWSATADGNTTTHRRTYHITVHVVDDVPVWAKQSTALFVPIPGI